MNVTYTTPMKQATREQEEEEPDSPLAVSLLQDEQRLLGDAATLGHHSAVAGSSCAAVSPLDATVYGTDKADGRKESSLLTPLIAEHLLLSTPSALVILNGEQETEQHGGGGNGCAKVVELGVIQEKPHLPVGSGFGTQTKRNRRALLAMFESDADREGTTSCGGIDVEERRDAQQAGVATKRSETDRVCSSDGVSPRYLPSEPQQQIERQPHDGEENDSASRGTASAMRATTTPVDSSSSNSTMPKDDASPKSPQIVRDRKRASPHEDYPFKTHAPAPVTNLSADVDDEPTLVIRKKWKRDLHATLRTASASLSMVEERAQEAVLSSSQPSRPSFTRSMSSQSVFSSKPSTASDGTAASAGVFAASASTHSLSAASPLEMALHQLVLPTIRSKSHPDLNVISPQTVSQLLNGEFDAQLASYVLIDCRFSYEYEGGNLKGSQSLCDPASVEQQFLWRPSKDCKRTALIFYCEFSANRAPKMLRHVRSLDRWIHAEQYPELFYPELYLIDGGYKNCYETIKEEICEPQSYTPMNHKQFIESCKSEFALWRKRWKAHKPSACAAKYQHQQQHGQRRTRSGSGEDFGLDLPSLHPPLTLRSFSEMHRKKR